MACMNTEEWRSIPEYTNYEASSLGRIRRVGKARGAKPGRVLAQSLINSGYMSVNLWSDNVPTVRLVHRLVYSAFTGPIPDRLDINHKNTIKTDNVPDNLETMTRRENIQHAIEAGLMNVVGENNPQAIITPEIVRAIRADHAAGLGYKRLAKKHGLTWGCVRGVATRRTWPHID